MKTLLLTALCATALCAQPARPVIGITVNGAANARLEPGWPLLISVSISAGDKPSRLALREGAWRNAVSVTIEAPGGEPIELQSTNRVQPDMADLQDLAMVSAEFYLDPDTTQQLPLGSYKIRAAFDPFGNQADDAWGARLESVPAFFELNQDPPEDEAAHQAERLLLFSYWNEWHEDRDQAMANIEELLAAQPRHSSAHMRKADLLEAAGRLTEALQELDQLEVMLREDSPDAPSPNLLHHRQAVLLDRILAPAEPPTEAPPESPPPPAVP